MSDKEYMTEEGLKRLKDRLSDLNEQLKSLRIYKGEEAIHAGDTWHDNPVLYEAEARERALMRDIVELDERIHRAAILETPKDSSTVVLGSKVEIRFADGSMEVYHVLGEADSDPSAGILSYKSPLGEALMGKSVGETVTYEVRDFVEEVEILSIAVA